MAVTEQPSGLMDIASSLTHDEIPFKLRCAICNKLAVNAFRLPCCDQAICETCQTSLPDTCPVCAHTPLSSDLCKPNKALRTTLKAFLRTEEKKREKDRQSATPATGAASGDGIPAPSEQPVAEPVNEEQTAVEETPEVTPSVEAPLEEHPAAESRSVDTGEETVSDVQPEVVAEPHSQHEQEDATPDTLRKTDPVDQNGPGEDDEVADGTPGQPEPAEQAQSSGTQPIIPNAMGFNIPPGGFPNMSWNGSGDFNPMTQFMPNDMFNPQNPMGMSGMAMDPMTASQGMFGGYGMNMNGMNNGMNMGMNFDAGQGMYGGWDGSQNSMWNGGQDKFNPSAFANGMGSQYGPSSSGFGGYNQPNGNYAQMQHPPFPNQDFSNGYYGPGYGRGSFRGRGRGGFIPGGRGRGGGFHGSMHANYPNAHNPAFQNPNAPSFTQAMPSQGQDEMSTDAAEVKQFVDGQGPGGEQEPTEDAALTEPTDDTTGEKLLGEEMPADVSAIEGGLGEDGSQLRGIPTIDSLDQDNTAHAMSAGFMGMSGPQMGAGFGRGFMRGPFPGGRGSGFPGPPFGPGPNIGQGVEGAPAAPRAMRQGLPNTSVLRQQSFQPRGRGSVPASRPEVSQSATPVEPREEDQPRSRSRSGSRSRPRSPPRSRSRSRSPSRLQSDSRRHHRYRSPSTHSNVHDYDRRRERQKQRSRREDKYDEQSAVDGGHRTRSPSVESSRRSSRRHEREKDRRSGRRSRRSHRHRSRSVSRDGDTRDADHFSSIPEENGSTTREKASGDAHEPLSRSHRSGKDRSSRREEDRERDRNARRRDRDRRDRDRDRDRHRERERDRDRDRGDRHRDRERDRDHRERDRKRSRRDRTASPIDSDYSTRHHSRRTKRSREDNSEKPSSSSKQTNNDQPEKDPNTLEREARNRERLLKEQQRREAMHSENNNNTNSSTSHHHHRDRDSQHKSSRRRDSRQDRSSALAGGRRLSYKYEDDESDAARAARVEKEREADRWA